MDETTKTVGVENKDDKKLIFTIPHHWQNYIASLFLIIVFPLAPVFIVDYMIINEFGDISVQSLSITAAIYFITIGFSSNNKLTLILGILGCFTFAVVYGRIEVGVPTVNHTIETIGNLDKTELQKLILDSYQPKEDYSQLKFIGIVCIAFISLVHGIERYNRHVLLKEPFFEII